MSSTGQATSSTSSVQSIIEAALADYTKDTGIDLSKTPFAAVLEHSNSPEAILQLLQEREKAFKEYREGNRKLINCLSPAVKVIQAFSGIIGEAVSLVSLTCPSGGDLLTVTSSDPLPTIKRVVCCHRYSPYCTSLQHVFQMVPL
jgi:fungal STAND N-terminal Goodbye domain